MAATNFGSSSIWLATAIQILPWGWPKLRTDKQISKPDGYQNSAAYSAKIVNPQYNFRTSKFEITANHNGQLFSLIISMNGEKHNFKTRDLVNFITIIQAHVWRAHTHTRNIITNEVRINVMSKERLLVSDVQMIWKDLMYLIMSNVHLLKQVLSTKRIA